MREINLKGNGMIYVGGSAVRLLFVSAVFLLLPVANAKAVTWYVDGSVGDDANTGLSQGAGNAFMHIQHAIDTAAAYGGSGHVIKVKRGILYLEDLDIISHTNLTLETYGPGSNPIVKKVGEWALYMQTCLNVDFDGFTFKESDMGLYMFTGCHFCDFTDCTFDDNDKHGAYVVGGTANNCSSITFTRCEAYSNGKHGFNVEGKSTNNNTSISWMNCKSHNNGIQGLVINHTNYISIKGTSSGLNEWNDNGATGIQIESGCKNVTIWDAEANDNGNLYHNEKGIWIDESDTVTLLRCTTKENPVNIAVTQSDDVTIDTCVIEDATTVNKSANYASGIVIGIGSMHYASTPDYTGQPFGGVRELEIVDCSFDNNQDRDVYFGDILMKEHLIYTPYDEFTFFDNSISGSTPSSPDIEDLEFDDTDPDYSATLHEQLDP